MLRFPELSSTRPIIHKALEILKKSSPGLIRYLSGQRSLAHMRNYPIVLHTPPDLDRETALRQFQSWLRGKRNRRLAYVLGEILLLPLAVLLGLLPGPNVFLYFLLVVLYFHFKALLSLLRVRIEHLTITVEPLSGSVIEVN